MRFKNMAALRGHDIRTRFKNRVVNGMGGGAPAAVQRYFTTLDSAFNQHLTFSSVTVDRIVMTVYSPTGDSTGLPTGAPTPTANKLETLDFVYSGSIAEIGKNGSDYFDGVNADIKLYNGGVLVAAWAVDEDLGSTTTVIDSVGSNDATAVNITASELFTDDMTGWFGAENIVNGDFSAGTDGWSSAVTNTADLEVVGGECKATTTSNYGRIIQSFATKIGYVYKGSVYARPTGGIDAVIQLSKFNTGSGSGAPIPGIDASVESTVDFTFTANSTTTYMALGSSDSGVGNVCYFDNVTVKQFMELA